MLLTATSAYPTANRRDPIAAALCAAESGEPFDLERTPSAVLAELFVSVQRLKRLVPFATLKLLTRLAHDDRVEVRCGVARALGHLADLYPVRIAELLLPLACDPARRVRSATAEALAALMRVTDPAPIISRWRWHPDRAADVLSRAQRLEPPSPLD